MLTFLAYLAGIASCAGAQWAYAKYKPVAVKAVNAEVDNLQAKL